MNENLIVAIIGIIIGSYFLIQRFKYPTKEGTFKFLINFHSLSIGISCLGAGLIFLIKYLIYLFGCN